MSRLDLRGSGERSLDVGQAPAFLQHTVKSPKGYMITTGPLGVEDEGETLMCVHCQMHWKIVPGSGRDRGFCLKCNGPTCGKKLCETRCIPFEKAIEETEARGRLDVALERTRRL